MAAQLWLSKFIPNVTGTVGSGGAGTAPGSPSIGPGGPLAVGDGVNVAYAVFSQATGVNTGGVSVSTSDVINFFLLPEGAVILDGYLCGICKTSGYTLKVGLGAAGNPSVTGASTDGDLLGSTSYSSTRILTRFSGVAGLPYFPAAITNTTYPKYFPINVTVVTAAATTGSISLGMALYYVSQQGATFV